MSRKQCENCKHYKRTFGTGKNCLNHRIRKMINDGMVHFLDSGFKPPKCFVCKYWKDKHS